MCPEVLRSLVQVAACVTILAHLVPDRGKLCDPEVVVSCKGLNSFVKGITALTIITIQNVLVGATSDPSLVRDVRKHSLLKFPDVVTYTQVTSNKKLEGGEDG